MGGASPARSGVTRSSTTSPASVTAPSSGLTLCRMAPRGTRPGGPTTHRALQRRLSFEAEVETMALARQRTRPMSGKVDVFLHMGCVGHLVGLCRPKWEVQHRLSVTSISSPFPCSGLAFEGMFISYG